MVLFCVLKCNQMASLTVTRKCSKVHFGSSICQRKMGLFSKV